MGHVSPAHNVSWWLGLFNCVHLLRDHAALQQTTVHFQCFHSSTDWVKICEWCARCTVCSVSPCCRCACTNVVHCCLRDQGLKNCIGAHVPIVQRCCHHMRSVCVVVSLLTGRVWGPPGSQVTCGCAASLPVGGSLSGSPATLDVWGSIGCGFLVLPSALLHNHEWQYATQSQGACNRRHAAQSPNSVDQASVCHQDTLQRPVEALLSNCGTLVTHHLACTQRSTAQHSLWPRCLEKASFTHASHDSLARQLAAAVGATCTPATATTLCSTHTPAWKNGAS